MLCPELNQGISSNVRGRFYDKQHGIINLAFVEGKRYNHVMNIEEAAKVLGVSTKSLRNYIRQGLIQAKLVESKSGPKYEIEASALEEFKAKKSTELVMPTVEGVEESGKEPRKRGRAISRVEKLGTEIRIKELPGVQSLPISLGPPRSSEKTGRYLESLPDVCDISEAATFLGVSVSTVRDYLRTGKLRGMKLGKGWKISKGSLEKFVKKLLG